MTLSMARSVEQLVAMHQNLKKGRGGGDILFSGGGDALEACKIPGGTHSSLRGCAGQMVIFLTKNPQTRI